MPGKADMGKTYAVFGHYGSGKTEFSVNYGIYLKNRGHNVTLLDMDIANPYFRSRERQKLLQEKGIDIIFNAYGFDIAEDMPAISPRIRAPLEDPDMDTVVDIGGNDSGARIIRQFIKYFEHDDVARLLVVNANRFETDTLEGALFHLNAIETEIELPITGIINNTHMLAESKPDDVIKGHDLCMELSEKTKIPVVLDTCLRAFENELKGKGLDLLPMDHYMRPSWLDAEVFFAQGFYFIFIQGA